MHREVLDSDMLGKSDPQHPMGMMYVYFLEHSNSVHSNCLAGYGKILYLMTFRLAKVP
jgi:hypothetical protein